MHQPNSQDTLKLAAHQTILYPRIDHLDQIVENIGNTKGFVIQENGPFIFVSYKIVSSDSFPSIPFQMEKLNGSSAIVMDLDANELNRIMLRREIRGLVFDRDTKRIVARSMPKFFNVDEKEETNIKVVDKIITRLRKDNKKEKPFVLLEKLDGSLCTPCVEFLNDTSFRVRFRTKLDYQNDHSQSIEEFVYGIQRDESLKKPEKKTQVMDDEEINDEAITDELRQYHEARKKLHESQLPIFNCQCKLSGEENESTRDIPLIIQFNDNSNLTDQLNGVKSSNLVRLCIDWTNKGYTPLFEYFSPDHRVVVNYGSPFLSLLALRHTILGHFLPYNELKKTCQEYGVECVKECSNEAITSQIDIKEIKKAIEEEKGHEGYVMVLDNGFMYKIKSDWYLNIHKTNEMLITESMREGRIWYMILENTLDDVLPHVHSEEHRRKLQEFNDKVIYNVNQTVEHMKQLMLKIESELGGVEAPSNSDYVKVAKEVCRNEKHSIFLGGILKVKNILEKTTSVTNRENLMTSLLLDVLVGYLKPLLKKVESVRSIITAHIQDEEKALLVATNDLVLFQQATIE